MPRAMSILKEARASYEKELGSRRFPDPLERAPFIVAANALERAIFDGISSAREILDFRNWDGARLLRKDGSLRRPRVFLQTYLTSHGNLVSEWFPEPWRAWPREESDFRHFSDLRPLYGEPENRILMLRGFRDVLESPFRAYSLRKARVPRFTPAFQLLIEATETFLEDLYKELGQLVELSVLETLYLEYDQKSGRRDQLRSAQILTMEDIAQRREARARAEWRRKTFTAGLGVNAEKFLSTYDRCGGNYSATSKELGVTGTPMATEKVRRLILQLFDNDREFFTRHCKTIPKGRRPDLRAV